MASSWITTPHLRPSLDAKSSEPRPSQLAGPFAVSAAQISVKVREDGSPGLDKLPTLSAPSIVTLQVKDGPRALTDAHVDVSTTTPRQAPSGTTSLLVKGEPRPTSALPTAPHPSMSPHPGLPDVSNNSPYDIEPSAQTAQTSELAEVETTHQIGFPPPKRKQAAKSQSSSSPAFEPQVLGFTPTTNSQAAAPISEASGSPTMGSPPLPPLTPPLIQSLGIEQGARSGRPTNTRSTTTRTSGTAVTARSNNTMVESDYTKMVFNSPSSWYSFFATVFLWILLAGFLVLPSTFPNVETIVEDATTNETVKHVFHSVRNHALLIIAFTFCGIGTFGLCIIWYCIHPNCVWLLDNVFTQGFLNGLSGLISTFVGIYGSQTGVSYGSPTIAAIAATGGCTVICSVLWLIYYVQKWKVVREHKRENEKHKSGGEGGGGNEENS